MNQLRIYRRGKLEQEWNLKEGESIQVGWLHFAADISIEFLHGPLEVPKDAAQRRAEEP